MMITVFSTENVKYLLIDTETIKEVKIYIFFGILLFYKTIKISKQTIV